MDEVRNFTSKLVLFAVRHNDEFLVSISSYGQLAYWHMLLASHLGRYLSLGLLWVHVKVHPTIRHNLLISTWMYRSYHTRLLDRVLNVLYSRRTNQAIWLWVYVIFFFLYVFTDIDLVLMNGSALIFLGLVSFGLLHIKVSDAFHSMKIMQLLFMAFVSPTISTHGDGNFI